MTSDITMATAESRLLYSGNFCSVYQVLKAYFCALIIFVVCPEDVIIVAYCLDFREFIFRFGTLRNSVIQYRGLVRNGVMDTTNKGRVGAIAC